MPLEARLSNREEGPMSRAAGRFVLAGVMLCAVAALATAQQQSTTTETKTFEVIAVDGNDLVVKLPEGTKQLTVPESFRFTVDGQPLSVHELKPGMKGSATITTKTTLHPVTVTEVKNGTVAHASASNIIVRTDQGLKSFTQGELDKRGVKIMKDGKPAQITDFRAGDLLTATIITTKPPRAVTETEVQATLARSAPPAAAAAPASPRPAAPPPAAPSRAPSAPPATARTETAAPATPVAPVTPAAPATPAAPTARQLPKTASSLPLVGTVGIASLILGLALMTWRRRLLR